MTGEQSTLSPAAQKTLTGWHRFVETLKEDGLRPLLADNIVFRSPFVHRPIPGKQASLLILTTVVTIFENFRYHRTFVSGSHDIALEFSANIGEWDLKGADFIKFDASGQMVDFEVMVRPIKALEALGTRMGARIGPQLAKLKEAAAASGGGS
jgi:hypothetical protein